VITRFNHVGIAAKDLERTLEFFVKTCGAREVWRNRFEDEKFETVLVAIGEARFELLGSREPGSIIDKFIRTRGEGIHHVSLEVDQFDQVIDHFKAKGMRLMDETDTKDFRAVFIHPQSMSGVLTEIIEPKGGWGT
jgi:methylmalonyl-CoA epimerase